MFKSIGEIPKGFNGIWEMQGIYRELLVMMNESE